MNWKRVILWVAIVAALGGVAAVLVVRSARWRPRNITIQGAVVRRDQDPRRQLPVGDVAVTASDGVLTLATESDASGYFKLNFKENFWPGQKIRLSFHDPQYEPLEMTLPVGLRTAAKRLYIAELIPTTPEPEPLPGKKLSVVSNIRIRYTVNQQGDENIGSAVRTFQVVNKSNVPCNGEGPCSPDGMWKAASGEITLDAGPSNTFRSVSASCIAGPCPFTRIDPSGFEHGGRVITARALDWSDTATFLVEAEVFRTSIASSVRESYPVIFARTLNFVLPATAEGVSIEADLDRTPMVFPLGPELFLSWANCTARASRDSASSTVYRCELKPAYRF
ncbi:carboxypeptidase regulatory-like domain-containing protein [Acidobacteria bacterium AB60]|nr:carboxypeptidase regulatory-like domain-containing protein [Acidobacteria bacterium AB60]